MLSLTVLLALQGTVFVDHDGDGVRDQGEPGVAKVAVSDGERVVETDAQGRYSLPVKGDAVVFISKPSGYMVPVDRNQLPQFYYVHRPKGSPEGLRYAGIAPTGPLPPRLDFPLSKREEPTRFEAILLADPQPMNQEQVSYLREDVVEELIGTDAKFGMTVGDIMFDDLSLLPRYNAVLARIGIPWFNVPGNHELNFRVKRDQDSLETYTRTFGPPYYSFDYGDTHFVVLDNVHYLGENVGRETPSYRGVGNYEGRIGPKQLAWLKADLARVPKDRLVFLAMHVPLETTLGELPTLQTLDRLKLYDLLRGRKNLYVVAGHTHTTEHVYIDGKKGWKGEAPLHHHILATASGAWWGGPMDHRGVPVAMQRDGTPKGYHVLEIDGVKVSVRYKAAGKPASHQMRIMIEVEHFGHIPEAVRGRPALDLLDGRLSVDEVPSAQVFVNLFDGGERSRVSMQIGEGPPLPLSRKVGFDPAFKALYNRDPGLWTSWTEPKDSTHLFTADLPDDLGPGFYTLTIRATDEFGRSHVGHKVLEIYGYGP